MIGIFSSTPSGGISGTGTTGKLVKWSSGSLVDSLVSESGSTVTVTGVLSVTSNIASGGGIQAGAGNGIYWSGRSELTSPSDGVISIHNFANTDFNRLQFGGTTSSFPALKRSTTTLKCRLADDSADAGFLCGALTASGNVTLSAGYVLRTVGNALTAAGTTRADALQLAAETNNVTTAAAGTGVILPVGVVGMKITLYNGGANAVQVYASASETIDGVAGSTGVPLTNAKRAQFDFVAANTWISAQLGVVSA